MDPPPPTTTTTTNPDFDNSSPRSWDDHPLQTIPNSKLRLRCSYGGHIIPRPHDKSLCYVGGDTRIVAVDRQTSLSDLHSRLSQTLLNGRHFTLKYQLPTEDLDSLISLSTDEDLENMIEEYDRSTCASPLKPSRLRLFLFPTKPDTAASMGSLLDDAKSETWFVDALNGSGLLPRGFSDSAAIDNLLELDRGMVRGDSSTNLQEQNDGNKQVMGKAGGSVQESVVMDSPPMGVMEMGSSFGSSSSSPTMSNLPPIKVRVDQDQMVGLDEQFSNVSIASSNLTNAVPAAGSSPPPPLPYVGGGATTYAAAVTGENLSRVVSEDEKSDQGVAVPTGLRKPPLPLQPVQRKLVDVHNLPSPDSKHAGGYILRSPDSVTSDSSIASATSLSKNPTYQDAAQFVNRENRVPTTMNDQKMNNIQEPNSQIPMQQMTDQVPNPPQSQNQQYTHYIQHPPMPVPSYYPMYLPQQTQQQSFQQQTDPQYAMYFMPPNAQQTQTWHDAPISAPTRPLTPPPNNPMVQYTEAGQPMYQSKPEMAANMYSTAAGTGSAAGQMWVQVPAHQYQQQQYIGLPQMPPQAQAHIPAGNANYGYEYSPSMQDQVYYSQHQGTTAIPPSQYQTISPADAMMLSQASGQHPSDSTAQQG
ncbi:hypothetical protein ACJIZ3_020832 [Penstemon smallii]|uniref:PB1 domain-containing protein n=1 Tax=Penstemon smallii TaxID=265156 RepID=A0ABD3SKK2_9LAMI